MQLEFYGAAGEVTGSCHVLTVRGRTLLLDCGMIQGGADPDGRDAGDNSTPMHWAAAAARLL